MGVAHGTYAFVHARLGALKGELLSSGQWEQLLSGDSFDEQRRLLESTSYADTLHLTGEETSKSIRGALHRTVQKVERSVPPQAARFIRMWGRRDLLRNLRTILRGKAMGRPADEIRAKLVELDPLHALPTESLLRCANLESTLDVLEKTTLRHWIRAARRLYEQDPTLFGLDSALDRLYYPELWQQFEKLDVADRVAVRELVALEIDQVNLLWLLRYRLNYHLSPAETYYLLVPVTGHITVDELKGLVRHDSLASVVDSLARETLRKLLSPCESIWQVEVAMWRARARLARQVLTNAMFTLGEAMGLLVLKIVEVRDLVAVFEGTGLGVGRDEIENQLVGTKM